MKKVIILLMIFSILGLTACRVDTTGTIYDIHKYIDPETGVNYIWINTGNGVAMYPRLNSDGTIYISEVNND